MLKELTAKLLEGPDSPGQLYTRRQAAKRLGVTPEKLQQMLFLGRLTRVKVRGRELIFL